MSNYLTQLMLFEWPEETAPQSPAEKMCPDASATGTTPSDASSPPLLEHPSLCRHLLEGGRVQVWLPAQKGRWSGDASTPNTSPCPNQGSVCSLSRALEQTSNVSPKYSSSVLRAMSYFATQKPKEVISRVSREPTEDSRLRGYLTSYSQAAPSES
jgi:hypothetical protein